jgi:DNA invertase Pin-like site-specific DNA recombinase
LDNGDRDANAHQLPRHKFARFGSALIWIRFAVFAGLERARAQGCIGGRPKAEDDPKVVREFRKLKRAGLSVRRIAEEMKVSPTYQSPRDGL